MIWRIERRRGCKLQYALALRMWHFEWAKIGQHPLVIGGTRVRALVRQATKYGRADRMTDDGTPWATGGDTASHSPTYSSLTPPYTAFPSFITFCPYFPFFSSYWINYFGYACPHLYFVQFLFFVLLFILKLDFLFFFFFLDNFE